MTERERQLQAEVERLASLLNSPLLEEFTEAVKREAAHQVERWSAADARKDPDDWFQVLGYPASKAKRAHAAGDREAWKT